MTSLSFDEKYCFISNINKVSKISKGTGKLGLKFNIELKTPNNTTRSYSIILTKNPELLLVTNVIKKV